jgi:chemotaxis protein methyltransferase CheR
MLVSDVQEISNSELKLFLSAINEKYGYNYLQYEKESIKRRIRHGMNDLSVQSFNRFKEMVLNDEDMFEFLFLEFSINVTDFFRDPEMYKVVRDDILPYLESFPHLKIWSAGCSTGLEPYSLAINLEETGLLRKTQIYASDINPYVVEEAKNGILPAAFLDKAEKNYRTAGGTRNLAEYFQSSGGLVRLREAYLNKILFFQHSLLNQGSFHEFQLILCRNVLIYFDKELQKQVLKLFAQSLDLNGFLVLGKNEAFSAKIPGFELIDRTHCIYKRTV